MDARGAEEKHEGRITSHRRAMRVVHLSSGHDVGDSRIFWKECLSLARAGYDVSFVVPCRSRTQPSYQQPKVEVIAVPLRESRFERLIISPFSVLLNGLRQHGDIYHFHDPGLLPASLLLRLFGKKVIYDVHEDVPRDILLKTWIPAPIRGLVAKAAALAEWLAGRTLSGFVAATPTIARRFPSARTALVQNFAQAAEFALPDTPYDTRLPLIAYVGGITVERCAIEMVRAMDRLSRFPDAVLTLAGSMASPALANELARLPGWSRVDFRGQLNRDGVRGVLSEARIGLALFHPVQSYIESQPVKLFEYMAAGLPVIASDFPGFRAIIETHRCGLCVPPRDIDALVTAIEYLLTNPEEARAMGERGRALMLHSYSWETEERSLLTLYERIANQGAR